MVMNDEESERKMDEIAERDEELVKKAMVNAAYRFYKAVDPVDEGGVGERLDSVFQPVLERLTEAWQRRSGNGMKPGRHKRWRLPCKFTMGIYIKSRQSKSSMYSKHCYIPAERYSTGHEYDVCKVSKPGR